MAHPPRRPRFAHAILFVLRHKISPTEENMTTRTFSAVIAAGAFALATGVSTSALALCNECGTVTDVKTVKKEGEASGAGAVIGGIAGGVLGHQVGSGRGKDVATVAGAAGRAPPGPPRPRNKKTPPRD